VIGDSKLVVKCGFGPHFTPLLVCMSAVHILPLG